MIRTGGTFTRSASPKRVTSPVDPDRRILESNMTTFPELFSTHVATSFARQLALGDFLDEHTWNVDIRKSIVDFGNDRIYPIQLLGSESEFEETWLWAWANEQSNLPAESLEACARIREFGQEHGISELTEPSFALTVASGHVLAMLSTGLIGNCCYYRGPYEGGALFFLVLDLPDAVLAPVTTARATTVVSEVISQFDIDHHLMAEQFLTSQGFTVNESGLTMTGTRPDGEEFAIEFDERGLITKTETVIRPRTKEA
jgi:hypothetical protein